MSKQKEKRGMARACDLLGYWETGNDHHHLNLDPVPPGEPSIAFHVQLRGDHCIPLSLLVFARDEKHAVGRVEKTMRACAKAGAAYRAREKERPAGNTDSRGLMLLRQLDAGELTWYVEPYDTTRMAAEINWASNGGYDF